MVTEIGRQPWLVTGILRTAEAVGQASGAELGASLTAYVLTYAALLLSYMVVITHLAGKGDVVIDLPLVFTVLMGVAILAYVVLDGYDLGVGMLMPAASRDEQNRMVASIGPFWDANETWLVLGIGLLLVAFPLAHGEILGALYLPVAAMLVGLMLRGVAFELRIKAEGWHRELWNWLFWAGSALASLAQGFMLGRYITGFAPGLGYWLFALIVAAGLCGGYVLLGATWLVLRTDGPLQAKATGVGALGPRLGGAWRRARQPCHAARERDGAGQVVRFPAHGRAHGASRRNGRDLAVDMGEASANRSGSRSPARWRSTCSRSSASPTACSRSW